MHPTDVKELLDASIAELGLPLRAGNRGPMLEILVGRRRLSL